MSEFLGLVLMTLVFSGGAYWIWRAFAPEGSLDQGWMAWGLHPRLNRIMRWSGVVVSFVVLIAVWGAAIHGWLVAK